MENLKTPVELTTGDQSHKLKKSEMKTKSSGGKFWANVLVKLQNLGQALLFPIAVLPFAALLNRFGSLAIQLHPQAIDGSRDAANWIGFIIQTPGKLIFDNIALIFAIGVAFGLSKDHRGEVALIGGVMFIILSAFLMEHGLADLFYKNVLLQDYWKETEKDSGIWVLSRGFSQLFYVPIYSSIQDKGLVVTGGQYVLNIGVIGGIVSGVTSAKLYNRYKDIKLPQALSFFGGRRFVPMIVMLITVPIAFAFAIIWPWIQYGLMKFGSLLRQDTWAIPGTFIYAFLNRIMQPFGLHHILNTFLWFQMPIANNIVDLNGHIVIGEDICNPDEWANLTPDLLLQLQAIAAHWTNGPVGGITQDNYLQYFAYNPTLIAGSNNTIFSAGGGQYQVCGDINAFQKNMISGTFQTGYFPLYWGGLVGAAFAMTFTAKKENRKQVATFLLGVGLVAMLTGIDEPLFFAFTFVGPILWLYNALFTATFATAAIAMHMHVGFGFSGGLIDYIISFTSSWGMSKWEALVNGKTYGVLSNPLWMFALAALMFPVYYFSFYFTIKKLDIKTPGREDEPMAVAPVVTKDGKIDKYQIMANGIIKIIGIDNIINVANCSSRLRLNVNDNSVGTDAEYKALGIAGVVRLGNEGLQLVVGTDVEHVADKLTDAFEINNKLKEQKKPA